MAHISVGEENSVTFCVCPHPIHQRVALKICFAVVGILNRKQIDNSPSYNECRQHNGGDGPDNRHSLHGPQPVQPVSDEQIDNDYPNVQKLMIGGNLDAELEQEGQHNKAKSCPKKSSL